MKNEERTGKRYCDQEGNVYSVEKAVRNGSFVVIRTNVGGNRKQAKSLDRTGNRAYVQAALDARATALGWKEVAE